MEKVFVLGAKRTPIGKFGGGLSSIVAPELGALAIQSALEQSKIEKDQVDFVLMGNVLQAGEGQNPARQAALLAGLPEMISALTVNDVCGSGLSSIALATSLIQSGQASIVVAGGMENMSQAPYLLGKARFGYRLGNGEMKDSLLSDALTDAYDNYHMGITAENIAERYTISRGEMDKYALESQNKAILAIKKRLFSDEMVKVKVSKNQEASIIISEDETPREGLSLEKLGKLPPVFKEDGSVTAGNSSGINDGAAAVVLVGEKTMSQLGLKPLVELIDFSHVGLDPHFMGLGPFYAINKLLQKQESMTIDDIDTFELNEAFAAQSIACQRLLKIDSDSVNPSGGAIALGHPVGASGCRILVTLIYNLIREELNLGIASLCVGGGMGVAALVRNTEGE